MEKNVQQMTYETPEVEAVDISFENSIMGPSGGCSTHCEGDIEDLCNTECQRD